MERWLLLFGWVCWGLFLLVLFLILKSNGVLDLPTPADLAAVPEAARSWFRLGR